MEIRLNDKFRLKTTNGNNWAVQKFFILEDGKEEWRSYYFYGTLKEAFRGVLSDPRIMIDMKTRKDHEAWLKRIDFLFDKFTK